LSLPKTLRSSGVPPQDLLEAQVVQLLVNPEGRDVVHAP
jgi:hypothetical protein